MIDLHTHSTASDGTLAPVALVELAAREGLEGLALTDHDTVAGVAAARQRAQELGVRFLAGIELSGSWGAAGEVHVLGYGVDGEGAEALRQACIGLRAARVARAREMVGRLHQAGVELGWEAVLDAAGAAPAAGDSGRALGRPHLARALVEGGWAADIREAFQRWLVPGAVAFVPKQRLEAVEAVRMIVGAGGAAVLAHPGTLALAPEALEQLVAELRADGLAGIEAYWARHPPEVVSRCERLATRHGLLATGGSDFHGANKPGITLGMAAGGRRLTLELMDAIAGRRRPAERSKAASEPRPS